MAVPAAPKRIICCFDGTWQTSVSGTRSIPSNITRLARSLAQAGKDASGKVWQQTIYYDSGVGTGALAYIEQLRQGGTGAGLIVNVIEAYNFLVNNYNLGDQIFCFGFSRGAYTARAVAGLVTDIGILKPENMQHFAPLFEVYRRNLAEHSFRMTKDYFEFVHGIRPMVPEDQVDQPYVKKPYEIEHGELNWGEESHVVEMVGVFDTVGSLGVAEFGTFSNKWTRSEFEFLNVNLSPYIRHAFHALALDEHRQPFLPTLWYIPNQKTRDAERELILDDEKDYPELSRWRDEVAALREKQRLAHKPDLAQVWFTGVHINVGGGNEEKNSDNEGLANVTFAWMVEQCRPYLAFHDWTFGYDGIAGYFQKVIDEEWHYGEVETSLKHSVEEYGEAVKAIGKRKLGKIRNRLHIPAEQKPKLVPAVNFAFGTFPTSQAHRWATSAHQDSFTAMYAAMGQPVTRTPGECLETVTGWYSKQSALSEIGDTNEWIHPSVEWRTRNSEHYKDDAWKYRSLSLIGFKRVQNEVGAWGYQKHDIWIPEWHITPTEDPADNAEWLAVDSCADRVDAKAFLIKLHVDWKAAQEKASVK